VTSAQNNSDDSFFDTTPNLSTTERAIYMIAGLGLAAAAAKPRPNPLLNVLALAGGSYLAWRGYVGNCPVKALVTNSQDHKELVS
jgi:threonine/homoserine/homoserine lactone efflux protein